jgi:predicted DNA-binding transcriptional regulator AlpA
MEAVIPFEQLPSVVQILSREIKELKNILLNKVEPQQEVDLPITIKEVAIITSLSVATLYGYVQRNEIPYHKKKKRLYFFKPEVINWIKTGRNKTLKELDEDVNNFLSSKRRK